jgi:hypothetical protein
VTRLRSALTPAILGLPGRFATARTLSATSVPGTHNDSDARHHGNRHSQPAAVLFAPLPVALSSSTPPLHVVRKTRR